ncbi:MAG TPA: hypothetical protein VH764_02375 [Gemmatimonadales bacterium]|jgi:hypothetical protein
MATPTDPTTLALTGQLPAILILATSLALPISLLLLRLYRRAVLRSMRAGAPGSPSRSPPARPAPPSGTPSPADLTITSSGRGAESVLEPAARLLYAQLARWRYRAAVAYALGGFTFAAVMTSAFLVSGGIEFLPVRFLLLFWAYAWPVVFTTTLVLGSGLRTMLLSTAGYMAVFIALGAIGVARSPTFDWGQAALFWASNNLPPTVLLLFFLNRRVRAVGPLVLVFMVLAVTGAAVVVSLTGSSDSLMRAAVTAGSAIGLEATGIFVALHLLGFVLLGVVGWFALLWIRRRYERKQVSDESITFDAIWLLFGVEQSIGLAFEGAWWVASGLVAFAGYKLVTFLALSSLLSRSGGDDSNARLLLLRVFALGRRSERLFEAVGAYWRHAGSIQLIAGPDLITKVIEPHEFLDFLSGRLARRFVDGPETLERRFSEMDLRRDHDGRFRVNEFFCHDDTWRDVLARLVSQGDTVLMDLRSFSPANAGVAYELGELLDRVPLERVVFAIDRTTAREYLRQIVEQACGRLRATSPNLGRPVRLRLLEVEDSSSDIRHLLAALCAATTSPVPAPSPTGALP